MKTIEGFEYVAFTPDRRQAPGAGALTLNSREWRRRVGAALAAGHRVRVENGETFIMAGSLIAVEIYARVRP